MNKDDAKIKYAEIIALPHHQSATRKHMSLNDRAAQFSSFAALSGYEDMVAEEARSTDSEAELSESMIEMINAAVVELMDMTENGAHPTVTITYFKPDRHKSGGSYERLTGTVKKVDPIAKALIFYGSDDIDDKRTATIDIPIKALTEVLIVPV